MNKFQIMSELRRLRLREHTGYYSLSFIEDQIAYEWNRHDTGEGLNIYLKDGDDSLHVYYDYNWFSERYEFNELGKKHGYLIDDAPWNAIIEGKFKQFEREIEAEKESRREIWGKIDAEKLRIEKEKLEKFKQKFANV